MVHCCKIKIQKAEETEASGAVRRTGEGHRKGEVECVEGKLRVVVVVSGWVFLVLSYTLLVLLASPGNGCYFLRNPASTGFISVCERRENSTVFSLSMDPIRLSLT